jgi:hypothetical protein
MAFVVKYRINFNTLEGDACVVDMLFDNYVGSIILLDPSSRPFVLREFNNDEDLYKPLRPQQAEINFISQTGISVNDFIGNSDEFCRVEFFHGGLRYWSGFILQDDVQEEWSDQKHIINLRASENLGSLKSIPLADSNGDELIGRYTALALLQIANSDAVQVVAAKNQFLRVISNLYNTSMNTASPGINQTYIDAKTFSVGDGEYEDKYSVIEKINRAFSQTLLQYMNSWYYFRPEELYMPVANNLRQFNYNPLVLPPSDWASSSVRFDINIGKTQTVKPIAPQMLRFIKRPTKVDKINFNYDYPSEVFPNQNFQRGNLITSTSTYRTYTINNWTAYKGSKTSPTPSTKQHYRKDILDVYGNKIDSYMFLEREDLGAENWLQSEDILVSRNDVFDMSFLWKWSETQAVINPVPTHYVAQVFLTMAGAFPYTFYLNEKGEWVRGSHDSSLSKYLKIKPDDASIQENKYMEKAVLANPIPADGVMKILFTNLLASTSPLWSQFQVRLQGSINGLTTQNIQGEFARFTKSEDIRSNFSDEIFLADLTNNNFNGCMFDNLDARLNPTWYRFRYNSESMSFMKQNLIAQWENTRFFRTKIDGTFYGLKQGSLKIGLINTIKFVDDDPNKLYAIVNMKEIDFANATWSATLVEVYDSTRDTGNETTYPTYLRDFIYK